MSALQTTQHMQNYVKKYESATFAQLFIAKCESIFIGDTFPTTNYMNWSLVFGGGGRATARPYCSRQNHIPRWKNLARAGSGECRCGVERWRQKKQRISRIIRIEAMWFSRYIYSWRFGDLRGFP